MPAATTSAMPRPVRETARTVRRPSVLMISWGVRLRASGRGSRSPIDWRQISAPPPAISTSGHTIASENQMPSARKANSTASRRKAVPSATSTAARPVRMRGRLGLESPAGITSQPSRYAAMPTPPAAVATTNATRTSDGVDSEPPRDPCCDTADPALLAVPAQDAG